PRAVFAEMVLLARMTVPPWLKTAPPIPDPPPPEVVLPTPPNPPGPPKPPAKPPKPPPPPKPPSPPEVAWAVPPPPPPNPPAPPWARPLLSVKFWSVKFPAAVTWNRRKAVAPVRVIVSPVPWMVTGLMTRNAVGPVGWGTTALLAGRLVPMVERLIVPPRTG